MRKRPYAGVLVRFLAVWLLSGLILGVVFGWVLAIGLGLSIASGYVGVVCGGAAIRRLLRGDSRSARVDRPSNT